MPRVCVWGKYREVKSALKGLWMVFNSSLGNLDLVAKRTGSIKSFWLVELYDLQSPDWKVVRLDTDQWQIRTLTGAMHMKDRVHDISGEPQHMFWYRDGGHDSEVFACTTGKLWHYEDKEYRGRNTARSPGEVWLLHLKKFWNNVFKLKSNAKRITASR